MLIEIFNWLHALGMLAILNSTDRCCLKAMQLTTVKLRTQWMQCFAFFLLNSDTF